MKCPAHTKPLPSSSAELVRVLVLNLKPYSGYIFKLSSSGQDSAFSADILTLAEGRPGSPPLLLSVRQLPQDRAVVEFTQPQIPNAKIISYSLTYSAVNFTSVEKGKDIIPLEGTEHQSYIIEGLTCNTTYRIEIKNRDQGTQNYIRLYQGTEHQSYIIEGLTCNTTYRIEIKAKSLFGTSEPGFTLFEYICPERIDAKSIPWALVAMNQSVYKKDLRPSKQFEAVILLSQFDEFIKCLDVHQEYRFMFIVTESGKLFRESIFKDYEETRDQFVLNTGEDPVEYITVDWLYDKLYILKRIETGISAFSQDWIIDICELDGLKCKRMQHFFTRKPQHLQVDPFHGYLYWVDKDEYDSLLRVNLTHTGCSVYPQLMLKSLSLGPFVVSFTDYSVYIPVLDRNMMFQVSLKPPFKVTVLNETRTGTRGFDDVDAIVRYNNIFYWTSSQGSPVL
ncbi:proto-oncogene tyrosine-protein kinase ROS [Eurytemora carolleeae]|uniref:proto-oncogene tyrosine-protein kinase ROS n=1 Tax=Eurytemora carolleeae TaxID=1294199 RepID=UPI000C784BB7|nr:proto-oncogene tyrosine-protein kinase ROS [Eurytemora carolleeae]|eukprot:XP_023326904.1 proto-oncogene tyrosine-protein kinase ROS-like [Eurytemora affinis]